MARTNVARLAFNRGLISPLGLARADIKRVALSADTQINWMTRVLGSMCIRPGLAYLTPTLSNAQARCIPFVFSTNDVARIELTAGKMRVFVNDVIVTRAAVSATVTNGNFDTDLSGWTDNDESGGSSDWVAGGYLGLTGNGTAAAVLDQQVTVVEAGVEHALKILVARGPVMLRVGSAVGLDDYISETQLDTGEHSLAITPSGNFWIRFFSRLKRQGLVDSCNVEAAGDMVVNTTWDVDDLDVLTANLESQSGDIIFVACEGQQQRKIERRARHSWSVVRYQSDAGPFRIPSLGPITLAASALFGNITVTASASMFKSTMGPSADSDGAMLRINSNGQAVSASITAENQFTNAIEVEGVGNQRVFTEVIDEVGTATFTLQRSLVSDSGPWTDVQTKTADFTGPFDDGLDNQLAWYRLGVKTGDYGSGTHAVSLNYTVGSISGLVRITGYTSETVVSAEVLTDLGGTAATDDWAESAWSDRRGWPTAGTFNEGRLCWSGKNGFWDSVSDSFYSFDETTIGDSGPISRTIGSGPVDVINWMLPLGRLILGAEGAEHSVKSSSLDEILTPTNTNIKPASNQGSSFVQAVKIDNRGIFVGKGGTRFYQLDLDPNTYDYSASEVSALVPEIGEPEVVRMAMQRLPDTRVHAVLSDGTVAVLVYDKLEDVLCWLKVETPGAGGIVEDVSVLPASSGSTEDQVYYVVQRDINGANVRYHEKWAKEAECQGGSLTKLADAFVLYDQTASSTITGLSHLAGEDVVVWDNGKCLSDAAGDIATFTVDGSGQIAVTNAGAAYQATIGVVGLPYTASWRSGMLVELMQQGFITDKQSIIALSPVLYNVHAKGLLYGSSLTESEMDALPEVEAGAPVDPDAIRAFYTTEPITFPGGYSTNERLCLIAKAPRPCTVLAALMPVEHHGS